MGETKRQSASAARMAGSRSEASRALTTYPTPPASSAVWAKSARRFDAVEPRHGDVEHDDMRMEPLRFSKKFASIADGTDDQIFAGQHSGRQREHGRMIISQEHARALRGAGVGDKGSGVHVAIYRRCCKSPILSKLTGRMG